MKDRFDVFLCHNSADKPEVKMIGNRLKNHRLRPWLDEWELRPGIPWQRLLEENIEKIDAVAVFVGASGIGPWQQEEVDAYLRQFTYRNCPVIPVILKGAFDKPKLPLFLGSRTWVDFRQNEPDPLEQLIWGITGSRVTTPELVTQLKSDESVTIQTVAPVTHSKFPGLIPLLLVAVIAAVVAIVFLSSKTTPSASSVKFEEATFDSEARFQ